MNTWPDGKRRALMQNAHAEWNKSHYPGTRQICTHCGEPTERCEEDSIYDDEGNVVCVECAPAVKEEQMVKRYSRNMKTNAMEQDPCGRFMDYADHAVLEQKHADLLRRVKEAREVREGYGGGFINLDDFDRLLPEGKEK